MDEHAKVSPESPASPWRYLADMAGGGGAVVHTTYPSNPDLIVAHTVTQLDGDVVTRLYEDADPEVLAAHFRAVKTRLAAARGAIRRITGLLGAGGGAAALIASHLLGGGTEGNVVAVLGGAAAALLLRSLVVDRALDRMGRSALGRLVRERYEP